jgi:hypothetical protein
VSESDKPMPEPIEPAAPAPETKGDEPQTIEPTREYSHEPPVVVPRGESGDVAAGHQPPARLQEGHEAPEQRGHQAPEGHIELGHPPAEGVVIVQQVGETHSPAVEAPEPTQAPPKPSDASQSVTPPPAREPSPPPSGGDSQND